MGSLLSGSLLLILLLDVIPQPLDYTNFHLFTFFTLYFFQLCLGIPITENMEGKINSYLREVFSRESANHSGGIYPINLSVQSFFSVTGE